MKTPPRLTDTESARITAVCELLSCESRLRVLDVLSAEGPISVTTLCARLRETQPALSHHLSLMKLSGLVECERTGKFNFYQATPFGGSVFSMLRELTNGRS